MIRQFGLVLIIAVVNAWFAVSAWAGRYELMNGSALEGDPIAFDARGVVIKLPSGAFAPREPWTNFTQNALKLLAKNAKAKPFVDTLIEEEEPEEPPQAVVKKLEMKTPPRLDRPDPKAGIFALFSSSLSGFMLFLVYLANLYAAYEIARYRNYHPGLVCGVAAVAPVIGPIIFLSLPTHVEEVFEEDTDAAQPPEPLAVPESQPLVKDPGGEDVKAPPPPPGALAGPPPPTIFKRPQTVFNRRFFETRLAGFLRLVPTDAEKDMVICVSSARGNYVCNRISKIMPNELFLQVKKGEATTDVVIPFTEVNEVQIRHKDTVAK